MKLGKIPKLCLGNGLHFPTFPEELQGLTQLEQRLVSARIPFMQLRELRPTTQLGIRGNIVNVPIEIENSVDMLPREFDRTSTIQLAFKRRIRYKGSFMKEWVRPHRIYEAARYLVNRPLYLEEGIGLAVNFQSKHIEKKEEFVVSEEDENQATPEEPQNNDD